MLNNRDIVNAVAYAALINGTIHSEQIKLINRLSQKYSIGRELYEEIILNDDTYDPENFDKAVSEIATVLSTAAKNEKKKLKRLLLKTMCYDGSFDTEEKAFFSRVFPNEEYSLARVFLYTDRFRFQVYGFTFLRIIANALSKIQKNRIPYFSDKRTRFSSMAQKIIDENNSVKDKIALIYENNIISDHFDTLSKNITKINATETTVAIVGKTKAGKSTLMNLLSGVGRELICKNSTQRTSKCPVITHYHGIKVVDTPGLFSSSKEGRRDEEAAFSEYEKADDILFLMANYPYGKVEMEGIDKISMMNKPLYILFNCIDAPIVKNSLKKDFSALYSNIDSDETIIKNELLKFSEEMDFNRCITGRTGFSMLYKADKKLILSLADKKRKAAVILSWHKIYRSSNFNSCIGFLLRDLYENLEVYRISRFIYAVNEFNLSLKHSISKHKDECEHNINYLLEFSNTVNSYIDDYENECKIRSKEVIEETISQRIAVSDEVYEKICKLSNEKLNEYINDLAEKIINEIQEGVNAVLTEEHDTITKRIKKYSFMGNKTMGSYSLSDEYKTEGTINVFKSALIPTAIGLAVDAVICFSPIGPIVIPISLVIDLIVDKIKSKTISISQQKKERTKTRKEEIDALTKRIKSKCINNTNKLVENNCSAMRDNISKIDNEILDAQKYKLRFDKISPILEEHFNKLIRIISVELLAKRQKHAEFIRCDIEKNNDGLLHAINIYAKNCHEEIFNHLRFIIRIRKEV